MLCNTRVWIILITSILLLDTVDASDGAVTLKIPIAPYHIQNDEQEQSIAIEGFGRIMVPGEPHLPARIFPIAIPPGAVVTDVSFETRGSIVLPGTYKIKPAPMAWIPGNSLFNQREDKRFHRNLNNAYENDDPYPSTIGRFVRQAGFRKYNLADVQIYPITFHPKSGRVIYHPNITVHVQYHIPAQSSPVLEDNRPRMEKRARELILNYDQAQAWYPASGASRANAQHDYVIILSNSELMEAVNPLVEWETIKGRTVKVVTLDWIRTNYSGGDTQEKARNFLRDKYLAWGIEDVLIVSETFQSDSVNLPMRNCCPIKPFPATISSCYTDYYYAELSLPDSDSWDKNQDKKWGDENYDVIDFYHEVNVGRIPWNDPEIVGRICAKSVTFENNNDQAFKKNMLFLAAFLSAVTDTAEVVEYFMDPVLHPWITGWSSCKMYEQNPKFTSKYNCDRELTHTHVKDRLKTGADAYVNWSAHGAPNACKMLGKPLPPDDDPIFIRASDLPKIVESHQDQYPAIVYANACENSKPVYKTNNIGKKMLKNGAVAFLGATEETVYSPGWQNPGWGNSSSMNYLFNRRITQGDTVGEALLGALTEMYTLGYWGYQNYSTFVRGALFGNPDLSLEKVSPLPLYISFPEGLPKDHNPPGVSTRFVVKIWSVLENYVPGTAACYYRDHPADPFSPINPSPLGNQLFEFVAPPTMPGDKREYYFAAQGDNGSTFTSPLNAPNSLYSFDVCLFDKLVFEDDFESDLGWTIESMAPSSSDWRIADPNGYNDKDNNPVQSHYDHSEDGLKCYVTGGYYPPDVDNGPTCLISPALDLSMSYADTTVISAYLWFYHSDPLANESLEIHLSNDNGATWLHVKDISHSLQWNKISLKVSDYVITPTAQVKVRFSVQDDVPDDTVEAMLDDFRVESFIYHPSLWADAYAIPQQGGAIRFTLDGGGANAFQPYLMLGSLSGIEPGITLPNGSVLPINWDAFTNIICHNLNTIIFQDFYGALDQNGTASATLSAINPLSPSMIGLMIYFAYFLDPQTCFTSNPVRLECAP